MRRRRRHARQPPLQKPPSSSRHDRRRRRRLHGRPRGLPTEIIIARLTCCSSSGPTRSASDCSSPSACPRTFVSYCVHPTCRPAGQSTRLALVVASQLQAIDREAGSLSNVAVDRSWSSSWSWRRRRQPLCAETDSRTERNSSISANSDCRTTHTHKRLG